MPDVYFDRSMIFLDSLLMHPSIFTTVGALNIKQAPEAFPNPVRDFTTIGLLPGESAVFVSVMDMAGSILAPGEYSAVTSDQNLTLNFSKCSPGVYLISFRSDKRSGHIKIVVSG